MPEILPFVELPDRRRRGVEAALREAIRARRIPADTRLPSTRLLAAGLGVARGTVVEAYAQLVAEGYLLAHRGAGTSVAGLGLEAPSRPDPDSQTVAPPAADFRPGNPDLSSFPRERWAGAVRRAMRDAPPAAFGYGDPRGLLQLREALSAHLARTREVRTDPAHIVVCSGFTQALGVVCQALLSQGGSRMAMEDPCLLQHREVVGSTGMDIIPLPVDDLGVRAAGLEASGADAVLVTPAHQAALGVTLHPSRRLTLRAWAHDSGGLVIDDDYDSEFRYDRQPVGALQGLLPQRAVYAGTASKTVAPGVRLAWLAVPPDLLEAVVEARRIVGNTSSLDQLAFTALLESGDFGRHLRRRREQYRRRRDLLLDALGRCRPRLPVGGIAAGLHAVVYLPAGGPTEVEAVTHLAERSVAVHRLGPSWHAAGLRPQALVVNYSAPSDHAYPRALSALEQGLQSLFGTRAGGGDESLRTGIHPNRESPP